MLLHARILLLTDAGADGPAWSNEKVVEALLCGRATVERVRRRWCRDGLEAALRVRQAVPAPPTKMTGEAEAHLIVVLPKIWTVG